MIRYQNYLLLNIIIKNNFYGPIDRHIFFSMIFQLKLYDVADDY